MNTANDKQVVLLPKGAVTEGKESRNPVLDLLDRAGYDKIRKGFDPSSRKPNREDQVEQGDFLFRAVKGPDALAAQFELFRQDSVGVVMGTDVLAEADLIARTYGVRADIARLLKLGIGPCSLQFVVPQESPVRESSDLDSRLLFTKYPKVLRAILQSTGRTGAIRRVEGADTRVNEYRGGFRNIGALEIVGSGDTARANKLQIVGSEFAYPSGVKMDMPYLDLANVTTDLYMTNVSRMGNRSRQMLRELGLALESARGSNEYVGFTFNIPASELEKFSGLGMKGPSVMDVVTRDGVDWKALQIYVPVAEKNSMMAALLSLGAKDLSTARSLQVEVAAERSEVLSALPFVLSEGEDVETSDRNAEIAEWLLALRGTIADRAASPKPGSSTTGALEKGTQFCTARFVGEMAELSKAVRQSNRPEIILEAGQAVYWLLVSMQSRGVTLEQVVDGLVDVADRPESDDFKGYPENLAEAIKRLRDAVRSADMATLNGIGFLLDQGLNGAAVIMTDRATELSTAFCKGDDTTRAANEAADALKGLIGLVELAGIGFDEVMDKERGK